MNEDDHEHDEESKESRQKRLERLRAARRRKKILENATDRMNKVLNLQQQQQCANVKDDELNITSDVIQETRRSPTPVEDPPDELVELTPQPSPRQQTPPLPSIMYRWITILNGVYYIRLFLTLLTGITAAVGSVAMGYSVHCFIYIMTSELCVLLGTLIRALMTRGPINQPQSLGTLSLLKTAIGLIYPPVAKLLDIIFQVGTLVAMVIQDLCLALFSLVTTIAIIHVLLP